MAGEASGWKKTLITPPNVWRDYGIAPAFWQASRGGRPSLLLRSGNVAGMAGGQHPSPRFGPGRRHGDGTGRGAVQGGGVQRPFPWAGRPGLREPVSRFASRGRCMISGRRYTNRAWGRRLRHGVFCGRPPASWGVAALKMDCRKPVSVVSGPACLLSP